MLNPVIMFLPSEATMGVLEAVLEYVNCNSVRLRAWALRDPNANSWTLRLTSNTLLGILHFRFDGITETMLEQLQRTMPVHLEVTADRNI